MYNILPSAWSDSLRVFLPSSSLDVLQNRLDLAYQESKVAICPAQDEVYTAFYLTPLSQVKVVLLGQDPYHGPNQAHGLSFSVKPPTKVPPSLRNIYKELQADLNVPIPQSGNLSAWAKQGVLLLNTTLTVYQGQAHSHKNWGWEHVTDAVIQCVSTECTHVVFILWGGAAKKKLKLIDSQKHTVLCSPHPSPLSAYRGFFGSGPFSKTNQALLKHHQDPINWGL